MKKQEFIMKMNAKGILEIWKDLMVKQKDKIIMQEIVVKNMIWIELKHLTLLFILLLNIILKYIIN